MGDNNRSYRQKPISLLEFTAKVKKNLIFSKNQTKFNLFIFLLHALTGYVLIFNYGTYTYELVVYSVASIWAPGMDN